MTFAGERMTPHVFGKRFSGRFYLATGVLSIVFGAICVPQAGAQATTTNPAQNIAGTWQGAFPGGNKRRIVIKVTQADGGVYKADYYNIDGNPMPHPATSITLEGSTVKLQFPDVPASYEGSFSPEGGSMTGRWTQLGPNPRPLILIRAASGTEWPISEPPQQLPQMPRMDPNATPSYEVATIKPSNSNKSGYGISIEGHRYESTNITLKDIISTAYELHDKQVTGLPAWANTDKYDLNVESDGEGAPNIKQWNGIIKNLLADRFHLTIHHDKRELSVYLLSVGKNGPALAQNVRSKIEIPDFNLKGAGNLRVRNANMADIAWILGADMLDRPVADQTGLPGRYDFVLRWTPDELHHVDKDARGVSTGGKADRFPDLFEAVQEQLGLKLRVGKAAVDVLVVDDVEKPSGN